MPHTLTSKITVVALVTLVLIAASGALAVASLLTIRSATNHLVVHATEYSDPSQHFTFHLLRAVADAEVFAHTREVAERDDARKLLQQAQTNLSALETIPQAALNPELEAEKAQLRDHRLALFDRTSSTITELFQAIEANDDAVIADALKELEQLEDDVERFAEDVSTELNHDTAAVSSTINRLIRDDLYGTIIAFSLLVLLTLCALLMLQRRIVRPIKVMSAAAAVVASGNLDPTIPVTSRDELGDLQWAFNQMVADLRSQRRLLEQHNQELQKSLTELQRAEEGLRTSEERYRLLAEHTLDLIGLLDPDGHVIYASPSHFHVLGYPPETLIHNNVFNVIHPDDVEATRGAFEAILSSATSQKIEIRLCKQTGDWIVVEAILSAIPPRDHTAPRVLLSARDITARKQAEELVPQAEARYRNLFEEAPVMYVLTRNEQGVPIVADCNRLFVNTLGYARAEVLERPLADFYTPASRKKLLADGGYRQALEGKFAPQECGLVTRDGRVVETSLHALPETDAQGRVRGTRAMFVDITARKRAEDPFQLRFDQLQALYHLTDQVSRADVVEQIYRAALDAVQRALKADHVAILLCDQDGNLRFKAWRGLSDAYREVVERSAPWSLSQEHASIIAFPDVEAEPQLAHMRATLRSQGIRAMGFIPLVYHGELLGKLNIYYDTPHAFTKEETQLAQTVASHIIFAIERKRAEEELRAAEAKYRTLIEELPATTYIAEVGGAGRTLYISPQIESLLGFTPAEWLENDELWLNHIHPDDHERVLAEFQRSQASAEPFRCEYRLLARGGHVVWVRDVARLIRNEADQDCFRQGIALDITARKEAEEELKRSQMQLAEAQRLAHIGSWSWDVTTNIVDWSDELYRIYGLNPQEFGATYEAFIERVHPDDRDLVSSTIAEAYRSGEQFRFDHRIVRPDGTVRVTHGRGKVIRDQTGKPRRMIGTGQDVTERKRAEEEIARRNRQLAVLNTIAAAVSSSVALPDVLATLETLLAEQLDVLGSAIFFYDQATDQLSFETGWGLPQALSAEFTSSLAAACYDECVIRKHEAVLWPNRQQVEALVALGLDVDQPSWMSYLCVPLMAKGEIQGIASLFSSSPAVFEDQLAFYQAIGQTVGMAVQNARLFEAEQRAHQTAETLHEATSALTSILDLNQVLDRILIHLEQVVPYDSACVLLSDGDYLRVVAGRGFPMMQRVVGVNFPLSNPLFDEIRRTGRPSVLADVQADPRFEHVYDDHYLHGWMGVPLMVRGEVIGYLTLDSQRVAAYSEVDATLVQAFANQAATALENARLFEQVRAGRERLQTLSHRLVEVQEAERRHIARELHDEIGQVLTGLKLMLEMNTRSASDGDGAELGQALALVNDLMGRVRELSLDLRPAMLDDLGLLPALLWHFERYTAQTHVRVEFRHSGLEHRFEPKVEIAAYRIVQEALTNVARHAQVNTVTVRLWADQDALGMQIEDHGIGFNPEVTLASRTSGGLSGMQERAVLLGGYLVIESVPGAGACLTAELPLAAQG